MKMITKFTTKLKQLLYKLLKDDVESTIDIRIRSILKQNSAYMLTEQDVARILVSCALYGPETFWRSKLFPETYLHIEAVYDNGFREYHVDTYKRGKEIEKVDHAEGFEDSDIREWLDSGKFKKVFSLPEHI